MAEIFLIYFIINTNFNSKGKIDKCSKLERMVKKNKHIYFPTDTFSAAQTDNRMENYCVSIFFCTFSS